MNTCSGDGSCLRQTTLTTYHSDPETICEFGCQPIKCPNYILCGNMNPQCILSCHHGLCTSCDILFGTWRGSKGILEISDNAVCSICLKIKQGISQPNCNNILCFKCFRRCYFYDDDEDDEDDEDDDDEIRSALETMNRNLYEMRQQVTQLCESQALIKESIDKISK